VGAEYAIGAVLLAGLGALHRRRQALDPAVYRPLRLALGTAVLAELAFTLYVDLYGVANFLGHALRILKVALEYVALIQASLTAPYAVLFRELAQREAASRRDLEERRQAEAALRESEARFATSFRSNPAWLTITNLETGRVLEVNEAWSALMGHSCREATGRTVAELGVYDEETWKRIAEEVRARRTVRNIEVVARTRTGDRRVLLVSREAIEVGGEPHVLSMGLDITERKRTEEALRESLDEKTALLKEVHHRVKNNLQVVASLLSLQAKRLRHHEAVRILQDTQARVQSMALLHELLYRSGNLAKVNIATHVAEVCRYLARAFGESAARVTLEQRVAPISLPIEHAIPCGLIVTELVSNALKHAFPGERAGRVTVALQRVDGDRLGLSVRDDGVGLPPVARSADGPTLGLQLVEALASQLGGSVAVTRANGGGAVFDLVFPAPAGASSEGEP
jgi:PAS domain S-box-containing protein